MNFRFLYSDLNSVVFVCLSERPRCVMSVCVQSTLDVSVESPSKCVPVQKKHTDEDVDVVDVDNDDRSLLPSTGAAFELLNTQTPIKYHTTSSDDLNCLTETH